MNELRERKNKIRDQYRALRKAMPKEEKAELDAQICKRFLSLTSYRFADILLLYAPLPGEVDILPIAEDALKRGKTVAFPRCIDSDHTMEYHIVTDLSQLIQGYFNIREPDASMPVFDPKECRQNMLCIIPGLCFDQKGYRLGYGKGYYDRYLTAFPGSKMGVVYSSFVVNELPRGKYDTAVDFLVTEKGVMTFNSV